MGFEPGEVVMLKSGGHAMTVVSATEEEVTCLWINDAGELFREAIPAVALESLHGLDGDDEDEDEENDDEEEDDDDEDEEDEKKADKKRT